MAAPHTQIAAESQGNLRTDGAKSYKAKVEGVLHDCVVRQKKRVKVPGKYVWQNRRNVTIAKHTDPTTGKLMKVKSGTQIVDRAWRFMKG